MLYSIAIAMAASTLIIRSAVLIFFFIVSDLLLCKNETTKRNGWLHLLQCIEELYLIAVKQHFFIIFQSFKQTGDHYAGSSQFGGYLFV